MCAKHWTKWRIFWLAWWFWLRYWDHICRLRMVKYNSLDPSLHINSALSKYHPKVGACVWHHWPDLGRCDHRIGRSTARFNWIPMRLTKPPTSFTTWRWARKVDVTFVKRRIDVDRYRTTRHQIPSRKIGQMNIHPQLYYWFLIKIIATWAVISLFTFIY